MATVAEVFLAYETANRCCKQTSKEGMRDDYGKFFVARSCLRELLVLCQVELTSSPRDEELIAELMSQRDSMSQ